jgi:hypothetical protein
VRGVEDVGELLEDARSAGRDAFLTEATVKTHATHVLRKLGLRDRVQAAIYAYEAGPVEPGAVRA